MPWLAALLSSRKLLNFKRLYFEFQRSLMGRPHTLELYLKLDDAYSYLLVQLLPQLAKSRQLKIDFYLLDELDSDMFPEPELWRKNALQDAAYLAELYGLNFQSGSALLGNKQQLACYQNELIYCQEPERVLELFQGFWQGKLLSEQTLEQATKQQLASNRLRLQQKGHYLPAMLFYAGEWYWGIDRLWHLEQRLFQLGVVKKVGISGCQYGPMQLHSEAGSKPEAIGETLSLYFSMRSPYSYLALEQAVLFCQKYGLELELKPVLPMVMRGLKVPQQKKMYIFLDTKREAMRLGLDYGKVADPLGLAVEYCYALYEYALEQGKGVDFMLQFARAVNSEGLYADNERGLKKIVERSGLNWQQAKLYLQQQTWRQRTDENLRQLSELGLWGVPCFQFRQTKVWGQDRLWVIQQQYFRVSG